MLTPYLNKVLAGHDLTSGEMEKVLGLMTGSNASCAQSGALLAALRMKGESLSELAGGARMLRRHAAFIDCGERMWSMWSEPGGDGGISFNISTTSAMVAAGAGVPMAKHGNRAVSGKCGAADVLAELGFNLNVEPAVMENCIQNHGIGFLFAQRCTRFSVPSEFSGGNSEYARFSTCSDRSAIRRGRSPLCLGFTMRN